MNLFGANNGNYRHGLAHRGNNHPLYDVWIGMRERCLNPKSTSYKHYGGRGITICQQWLNNPAAFVQWAMTHGWKPGLTIERKNNNKGYSPANCTFIVKGQQSRNQQQTKLTLALAKKIRQLIAKDDRTHRSIATQFGVSPTTVGRIASNKLWMPLHQENV